MRQSWKQVEAWFQVSRFRRPNPPSVFGVQQDDHATLAIAWFDAVPPQRKDISLDLLLWLE